MLSVTAASPACASSSARNAATPGLPRRAWPASTSASPAQSTSPRRRASSTATCIVWAGTTAPRSSSVRPTGVTGMPRRRAGAARCRSVLRCTRAAPGRRTLRPRSTDTSGRPGRMPSSCHRTAADRCDATAPGQRQHRGHHRRLPGHRRAHDAIYAAVHRGPATAGHAAADGRLAGAGPLGLSPGDEAVLPGGDAAQVDIDAFQRNPPRGDRSIGGRCPRGAPGRRRQGTRRLAPAGTWNGIRRLATGFIPGSASVGLHPGWADAG